MCRSIQASELNPYDPELLDTFGVQTGALRLLVGDLKRLCELCAASCWPPLSLCATGGNGALIDERPVVVTGADGG